MASMLDGIKKSGDPAAPRSLLIGPPGVGKTTAAALSYKPVFAQTEDGMGLIEGHVFPKPKTIQDFLDVVKELTYEDHDFGTLTVDTINGIERLCDDAVCLKHGKEFMSDFPFFRGNMESVGWLENILHDLDTLREQRNMQIILIAHSARVTVEDPTLGAFDRMEPAIYKKAVPMLIAWADIVAYMDLDRKLANKSDKDSSKNVRTSRLTGSRFMHFTDNGAFIAKNRRGLPDKIEIGESDGWGIVEQEMKAARKATRARQTTAKEGK